MNLAKSSAQSNPRHPSSTLFNLEDYLSYQDGTDRRYELVKGFKK
jgi:hypothetical protein